MVPLAASRARLAVALAVASLPLAACSPAATTAAPSSAAPSTVAASTAPATSAPPSAVATSASATPSATASATPKPTPSGYTMAQVKKHAGAASCWSVVDGTVYDLTKWVNRHPGGRGRILSMCGTDGSRLFHGEHGKESRPNKILAGYELGKLS